MASWRFIIKYIVCARIVLSVQYFQNKTDLVTKFGSDLHSQGSNSHHRLSQMTFVRSLPSPKQYKYSRRLQLQNSHPPNNKLPRIVSQTNNNHDYRGYDSHLGSSNEYLTLLINGNESQSLANLSSVFKSSTVIYPRYTTKLPNIIYPENSSYPGPGNSGYRGQGKENAGTHPALKVSTNSAVIGGEPPEKHPSCFSLPVVGDCLGAFKRYYYNRTLDQCTCYFYGGCSDDETGGGRTFLASFSQCLVKCHPSKRFPGHSCGLALEPSKFFF